MNVYYESAEHNITVGPLAQLVEHRAFNPLVVGSNPTRPTINTIWRTQLIDNTYAEVAWVVLTAPDADAALDYLIQSGYSKEQVEQCLDHLHHNLDTDPATWWPGS